MPYPDLPTPTGSFTPGDVSSWWTTPPNDWIAHSRQSYALGQEASFLAGLPAVPDATSYYAVRSFVHDVDLGNALWATLKATGGFFMGGYDRTPDGVEHFGPCWLLLSQAGSLDAAYDLTPALLASVDVMSTVGLGYWKRNALTDALNELALAAQLAGTYVPGVPPTLTALDVPTPASQAGWDHMVYAIGHTTPASANAVRAQGDAIRSAIV